MDAKEYKKLLETTIIPSQMPSTEKAARYGNLKEFIEPAIPKKLYRLRKCNELTLDAFWKDQLWFSSGSVMNDDFDARMYYNKNKIKLYLNSLADCEGVLSAIKRYTDCEAAIHDIEMIIPNARPNVLKLKKLTSAEVEKISEWLIEFISANLDESLKHIADMLQRQAKYACFTENIYSAMMWGHYAENASGFAVEYTFDRQIKAYQSTGSGSNTEYCDLFPVLYDKERVDATALAIYLFQIRCLQLVAQGKALPLNYHGIAELVSCSDEFMIKKLAIYKSSEWKAEKEWRMFYTTDNPALSAEKHSYVTCRPNAVFLGRNMSAINRKIILDIAKEKGVPAFEMQLDDARRSYKLRAHVIENGAN